MPTNPGTTGLVSWWALDEASGTRVDSHGANDLTPLNAPGSASGIQGNAVDLERDSDQGLEITDAAQSGLSFGDADFTVAFWHRAESSPAALFVVTKDNNGSGDREYIVVNNGGAWYAAVFRAGDAEIGLTGASVTIGSWQWVVMWHDAGADTLSLQVNNGTPASRATGGALQAGDDAPFRLGDNAYPGAFAADGLLDEVSIWARVLTADERSWLYNSGAGRAYSEVAPPASIIPHAMHHYRMMRGG